MPRSRRVSPRRRPNAIELRRSAAYVTSRLALDVDGGLDIDLIEEEIAADPSLHGRRHERSDGSIVDFSGPGLLVAYRVIDPDAVELIDLLDLTVQ